MRLHSSIVPKISIFESVSWLRAGQGLECVGVWRERTMCVAQAADRAAEAAMRALLHLRLPSHGVFGEEGGLEAGAGEWTWVLDPIDGTKSFITGALSCAVRH